MLGRVGRVAGVKQGVKQGLSKQCTFSTAPAPAAAEAIEALQHVSEEERRRAREGRLDRDKVHNIKCKLLIFALRTWGRD